MKFLLLLAVLPAFLARATILKNTICELPHSQNGFGTMTCLAYGPSWTYNQEKNECVYFVYGGCGGNANRFGNKIHCESICVK